MKEIEITLEEFKENLSKDPRIKEDYVEYLRLPLAFATGNKFLRKYILERTDYRPDGNIPSDWFQFSQKIDEFEVSGNRLVIKYDEDRDTHPPLMSRSIGK